MTCIRLDSIRLAAQNTVDSPLADAFTPRASAGPPSGLAVADIGHLYRRVSPNLLRIVRSGVRAPDPVIEDACQLAWSRLLRHRERVQKEKALSWLVTTALHEASRLVHRAERETSLETLSPEDSELAFSPRELAPLEVAEARERLRSLTRLPKRQQRLLWLRGVGLSYEEIARTQGCTSRTVERQLRTARASLRGRDQGR